MKYSHLYLKNPVGSKDYVSTNRVVTHKEEEDNDSEEVKDYSYSKQQLTHNLRRFRSDREYRKQNQTIEVPEHLEYLEICFFKVFNDDANYEKLFGLIPVVRTDFNKTILFYIKDETKFQRFIALIEQFVNTPANFNPGGSPYDRLTLLYSFTFLSSAKIKSLSNETKTFIIALIDKNQIEERKWRVINFSLMNYLDKHSETVIAIETNRLYEITIAARYIDEAVDNFDVIQKVQSSPFVRVFPSAFKQRKFGWNFHVLPVESLPVIGIIDTGIKDIEPFQGLIVGSETIMDRDKGVHNLHGTNVASLSVFGRQLVSQLETKRPDALLYSIQVVYDERGTFSLAKLKEAIIKAYKQYGVRIFNISMSGLSKDINSAISEYAQILDELSYSYDILFFISTGNLNLDDYWSFISDIMPDKSDAILRYPNHFYNREDPNLSQATNLGAPAESMNNLTIGAIADNLMGSDTDLTDGSTLPAYYTQKYYVDYSQRVNGSYFMTHQKNPNIIKPDVLMPGGDWCREDSQMPTLGGGEFMDDYYVLSAGTSLSAPLAANLAARIVKQYSGINMQSVKALIINAANSTHLETLFEDAERTQKEKMAIETYAKSLDGLSKAEKIDVSKHCTSANRLQRLIEGYGAVMEEEALFSSDKRVTFLIEDTIRMNHHKVQHIKIPAYLLQAQKRKIVSISVALCFKFSPVSNNQLAYNPIHLSFRFMNAQEDSEASAIVIANQGKREKEEVKEIAGVTSALDKWSDDFGYVNHHLFSNSQKKTYQLYLKDLVRTGNELAVVVRCVGKKQWAKTIDNPFSLAITIEEIEDKKFAAKNLYEELKAINQVELMATAEIDHSISLEMDV